MISAGDPLRELAQIGPVQQFPQLRLSDQNDLQQLLGGSFQVGQEADLLQHLDREILRLIHQHDDAPAFGVRIEQPSIQRVHHLLDAVAIRIGDGQAQLLADREQKFHRGDAWIQDHGDIGVMRDTRQEGAHHGGFAGAHFAGQLDEATRFIDAIQQMRQGLRMTLAQIEIARVRSDGKRLFSEPKEA